MVHIVSFFRSEFLAVWNLLNAYRPERHFMRGPGPKWRAKHAGAAMPRQSDRP